MTSRRRPGLTAEMSQFWGGRGWGFGVFFFPPFFFFPPVSIATGLTCGDGRGRSRSPPPRGQGKRPPPIMEPLRLVPLLASLQLLLPRGSPAVLPPPPTITVMPEKIEYLIGDTISIRCVAPWTKEKIQGFQFSGTSGWAVDVRMTRRTYEYRFNLTGPKDGGAHACTYTVLNQFRQLIRSQESKSIIISVKDRPPRPTLVLKSSSGGVTLEGQPLVFLCAAPAGEAERRFHFYKEKTEVIAEVEMILKNAEVQLQVVANGQDHSGNFSCGYEEKTDGRWISSYLSQGVEVLVKEAPWAPRLEADPPEGVVSEAEPLRLTCVTSRVDFRLRFRFYRNGVEMPPGQGGSKIRNVGNFSELFFPQNSKKFNGKFSCGVEEEVGGTWVASPRSQAVDVIVKDLPSQPALLSDPPTGEVIDGDPLVLTCAADAPPAPRRFVFYKDDAEQFAETTTKDRALFSVPAATPTLTTGRFTCRYEEKLSDRWIPSPFSQAVVVTTQARSQLIPLAGGCAAGAVTLILGLLLAVWLYRRRRGGVQWKGFYDKDDPSTYPMTNINSI
ncbi:Fc receptor-like protein 4 [Calonectris borealis]|uniref:Fc receptor-like protein 4 n=1 Tax=Calonectris borealis TaxID=1323832 RepID=UPI003F4C3373